MLLDALKAEQFRFWRDRGAVTWGFAIPGVGVFALGVIATLFVKLVAKAKLPGLVNLGSDMVGALSGAGSPITQIFFLIGAAAIFGTDYRWETWRLQTPRNSRLNLMLAKFAVYAGATALGLVGMALGGALGGLARAVIETVPLEGVDWAAFGPAFLRGFAGAWLELLVVGSIAAFVAVLTRTNVAAIIVTLLLAFAQAIIMGVARPDPVHPDWDALLSFPGLSAQVLRGGPAGMGGVTAQGAELATVMLLVWIAVLAGLTILLFTRQELTRE
ncbi:MAG: ABC transporter permease [Caulobacter sp.]|nr:ABC transporter permease [Caulobacter sp.]